MAAGCRRGQKFKSQARPYSFGERMDTHTDVLRPESNRGSDQGLQQNGKRQYGRAPLRSLTGELGDEPTVTAGPSSQTLAGINSHLGEVQRSHNPTVDSRRG